MILTGSCLCGEIAYEIDGLDGPIGHCHCGACRKAHASAYTSTARVMRDRFRLTRGGAALKTFESSPGKQRRFCGNCGTHVYADRAGDAHVILRVATLDDDPGARPAFHIWTAHAVDWLDPDCPAYAEWQPGR